MFWQATNMLSPLPYLMRLLEYSSLLYFCNNNNKKMFQPKEKSDNILRLPRAGFSAKIKRSHKQKARLITACFSPGRLSTHGAAFFSPQ